VGAHGRGGGGDECVLNPATSRNEFDVVCRGFRREGWRGHGRGREENYICWRSVWVIAASLNVPIQGGKRNGGGGEGGGGSGRGGPSVDRMVCGESCGLNRTAGGGEGKEKGVGAEKEFPSR